MEEKKISGLGVASLVLGIIGMLLSCLFVGIFPSIIGLILAIVGMTNKKSKHGTCIAGLVCSVIGIGIFLIMLLFVGLESDEETVKKVENNSTESIIEEEKSDIVEEETENVEVEEKNYFTVGESFEVDGLVVTINALNNNFTDYEDPYGFNELESGKKYISAAFTFENNGKSDKYVSIYDFDCYADGTACEQSYAFGGDFINTTLSSGRNASFETYYVVPVDCEVIELEYNVNMFTNEKVLIRY